jgi:general secretion pathway protein G
VSPITRSRAADGFTLIELLVVIAVISVLAGLVAPTVFRNVTDAKVVAAKAQMELLSLALEQYRLDSGSYPSTEQGLDALRAEPTAAAHSLNWRGPYLRKPVPQDPWGRPYVYRSPGAIMLSGFDLISYGRDGQPGGLGEDADLGT